ncbi:NAD-dependent succinate-semialdehyde dehydrogenase [Embleya scabrispora]|uniref:NAD-dependent succinate-semialdehyde dehydrogenase n=1 Tax=Embleya scabrispora TaxID=159449 RepID=UPI000379760A|nr:NAD-dependent succinate-semialdehyde dehydrogenase [Embleya scabrispora]MYS80743.1 aldehyde dehydrogenase family protein [Streptomyces sp. SID5474]
MTPIDLFIGGRWLPAASGQRIEVINPATGDTIASVAAGNVDEGLAAVAAAHEAGPGWAATPPRARAEILRRAFDLMTARADEIADLIVAENGKSKADALSEVGYAAEFFRWYSEEAVRIDGDLRTAPAGGNKILVLRQPIGVAVLVTPWNFPAAMATRKIGPALAAGCTVVLKPASETPLTALLVAEILAEAGVPAGVVNVVVAERSGPVVAAMLHDRRVAKLSFTGSTEVGSVLLREAADTIVSCSMELGGNAPFIVFADADLDAAIEGALIAKMRGGGQACTAANRFYVEASIADEFAARLAAELGDQEAVLISAKARERVDALVVDSGTVLTGGAVPAGSGFFYPATVLADVPADAPILRQEIFGPVAPIVRFDSEAEVVAAANDTEYGLAAYVYTGDLARGLRVGERLDFGMVALNRGLVSDPAAPFGGVKQSGIGREGGHDGLLEFLETKYIATCW